MFTTLFWLQALERGVKTAAQSVLLGLGFSDQGFVNAFDYDWGLAGGFALGGFILSLLTSVISAPFSDHGTPSLVTPDVVHEPLPPVDEGDGMM